MAQVLTGIWEARRNRATTLQQRQPFAAQILSFFRALLPVQEEAFVEARAVALAPERVVDFVAERVAPRVAAVSMESGPAELRASVEQRVREEGPHAMVAAWMNGDAQPAVDRYLARASLSPVLEALDGGVAGAFPGPRDERHCPRCGGPPQLSYFDLSSDDLASGGRRLVCARCHAHWGFPRMTCPGCGETSGSQLPIYSEVGTAAGERGGVVRGLGTAAPARDAVFPHIRIEGCDRCKSYVLNIDLAAERQAVPLVDEMAALPLDLYARDRGLTKITPNLMGF